MMTLLTENPLDGQQVPRNSIAFKWKDEIRETTLSYIEWSASRTGLINPVAVFEPVELEGNHGQQGQCPQSEHYGRAGAGSGRYHNRV